MAIEKKERNEIVIRLLNKGMSHRKIADLFKITHTAINGIDKRLNTNKLEGRTCVLCGNPDDLINGEKLTICKNCLKSIEMLR